MLRRLLAAAALLAGLTPHAASAQAPLAVEQLQPPTALAPLLRNAAVEKARTYPFVGFRLFARDSVLLVFEDSTLTAAALDSNTWMFGPPVTVAEADSCPPEKVLGRKIARVFWSNWGRPAETQLVMVAVRGTRGMDRWTVNTMYYQHSQLDGPWAGDPQSR